MVAFIKTEKRKVYHQKSGTHNISLPKWWIQQVAETYGVKVKELKEIHVIAIEDILILSFRNKRYVFEFLRELERSGWK